MLTFGYLFEAKELPLMNFPKDEWKKLSQQNRVITTRVSKEMDKWNVGDLVLTPWDKVYQVVKKEICHDLKDHPYYEELSKNKSWVNRISRYPVFAVLTLELIDYKKK